MEQISRIGFYGYSRSLYGLFSGKTESTGVLPLLGGPFEVCDRTVIVEIFDRTTSVELIER